jgi:hypothetical protein
MVLVSVQWTSPPKSSRSFEMMMLDQLHTWGSWSRIKRLWTWHTGKEIELFYLLRESDMIFHIAPTLKQSWCVECWISPFVGLQEDSASPNVSPTCLQMNVSTACLYPGWVPGWCSHLLHWQWAAPAAVDRKLIWTIPCQDWAKLLVSRNCFLQHRWRSLVVGIPPHSLTITKSKL